MTDAHHDAPGHDQWRGREAVLLGAEQRRHDDVPAGTQRTVTLDGDPVAKSVEHQRLLGVGESDLPRVPACLSEVSGDAPVPPSCPEISTTSACAFDTPVATVPHAHRADQLDVDARLGVGVLQIVDQLGEVLDRVDVVVRRWRDQRDARRRMPGLGDPRVHLVRRKLAALTGFRPLGHLDLDVGRVDQVVAGDTEPPGRDLLDGAAAFRVVETVDVLAALARVRATADLVHRHRDGLVGLGRDRAVAHGTGVEALQDLLDRFHLLERDRFARIEIEFEETAERAAFAGQPVDLVGVLLEDLGPPGLGGVLQQEDGFRGGEQVQFAVPAVLVLTAGVETAIDLFGGILREGAVVTYAHLLGQFVESHAFDARHRAGEVLAHHLRRQAHGLESLCGGVGADRGDTHLAHHLQHTLAERLEVVADRLRPGDAGQFTLGDEVLDRLDRQVRVDRGRPRNR